MDSDPNEWCLIESCPGVFTSLISGFGATGVQVEELYELNMPSFEQIKPIHGLIFLFKWMQDDYSEGTLLKDENILSELFFAKQVINNACATQAIINILMNCSHPDLKLGQTLTDFKEFTRCFDSNMKGLALSNAEQIRQVHNSFARHQVFEFDGKSKKKDKEDAFHFISYIPFGGRLLELDGLKAGPFDLGPIAEGEDWLTVAQPHIEKRMKRYASGEILFNLMAVVSNQKTVFTRRLSELEAKNDPDAQPQIEHLKMLIVHEDQKMARYKSENIRRKFNYLPLIMEVLTVLAQQGKLVEQYDKAKQKSIQLQQVHQAKKKEKEREKEKKDKA